MQPDQVFQELPVQPHHKSFSYVEDLRRNSKIKPLDFATTTRA